MKRSSLALTALLVATLVASGCAASTSSNTPGAASTAPSASTAGGLQALPPTIVSPGELDGTDVAVVIGTALVVAVEDGTEDEWTGTTADSSIAEFSAGSSDEGATFRPGFEARSIGSTTATLRGPDGNDISFTISVVAP